jgi:hypothetical protein
MSRDTRYTRLLARVYAIVFYGTLHRGVSAAAWGSLAAQVETISRPSATDRLLSELHTPSPMLDLIQADFLQVLQGACIAVHSFQEARGLSAISGLRGKVCGCLPNLCPG